MPPPAPAGAGEDDRAAILLGKYELGRLLGRGGSARVYLARDLHSGQQVAIKVYPNPTAAVEKEILLLRRIHHRHVVRLYEVLATRSRVYLVMELAAGGELVAAVESAGRLPEDLAREYFRQLISAVGYCHRRGVYHRDIKPENLLIGAGGDLKVADFGLGALAGTSSGAPAVFRTQCGTPAYVAPELLAKKGNAYDGGKLDVWSCGVALFAMAAGYLPFNDVSLIRMYKKICRAQYSCPPWFSPELRDLLAGILDPCPATRMTVDGIVGHPWFADGLDREEWTATAVGDVDGWKDDAGGDAGRAVNAFDIIGSAPGCDLSGLFGGGPVKERLFLNGPAEVILGRVEDIGSGAGVLVQRSDKSSVVVLRERNGDFLLRVEVRRVSAELSMMLATVDDRAEAARFFKDRVKTVVKPDPLGRGVIK